MKTPKNQESYNSHSIEWAINVMFSVPTVRNGTTRSVFSSVSPSKLNYAKKTTFGGIGSISGTLNFINTRKSVKRPIHDSNKPAFFISIRRKNEISTQGLNSPGKSSAWLILGYNLNGALSLNKEREQNLSSMFR